MCPNLGKDTLFETEEAYQEPDGITVKVLIYGDSSSHPGVRDLEALEETRACLLLVVGLPP